MAVGEKSGTVFLKTTNTLIIIFVKIHSLQKLYVLSKTDKGM
jgi:hypothetical protein